MSCVSDFIYLCPPCRKVTSYIIGFHHPGTSCKTLAACEAKNLYGLVWGLAMSSLGAWDITGFPMMLEAKSRKTGISENALSGNF